jgi:benzoyl-CoA reductase subunit C
MDFEQWQSDLDHLISEPESRPLEAAAEQGAVPIAYTCSYVPRVILSVDGLVPVRIRAPGATGTEIADIYLSSVICSYTRSLLEFAMDDRYAFLGGWVFASGCDHVRRLLDNLDYLTGPAFTHMVDPPHRTGDTALQWYCEELTALCQRLSDHFSVDTGPAALRTAIHEQDAFHRQLQAIADLRKQPTPPLSGTEFQRIMIAAQTLPTGIMASDVKKMLPVLDEREGTADYRARLMLVSGNLDDIDFIQAIESTGALVVADRFCTGSMPGIDLIEDDQDPLRAIARHTLFQTACPRMMEDFEDRLAEIMKIKEDYRVDGIVVTHLKFCDVWGIEAGLLTTRLREMGIPALRLERDYRLTNEGSLQTRIQAFLERMGK